MIKLTELITQHWISDLHRILNLIAELDWYVHKMRKYIIKTYENTTLLFTVLIVFYLTDNITKLHCLEHNLWCLG